MTTTTLTSTAPATLRAYYAQLADGIDAYGDGSGLRALLADDLDFTGSLAGHIPGAPDGFVQGAAGFVATVQRIDVVQEVHDVGGSAVLYDATMPGGVVRFAEFFLFDGDRIARLELLYDGQDYLAKGGR